MIGKLKKIFAGLIVLTVAVLLVWQGSASADADTVCTIYNPASEGHRCATICNNAIELEGEQSANINLRSACHKLPLNVVEEIINKYCSPITVEECT